MPLLSPRSAHEEYGDIAFYLTQIRKTPLFTLEEEQQYAKQVAGHYRAIRQSIRRNVKALQSAPNYNREIANYVAMIKEAVSLNGISETNINLIIQALSDVTALIKSSSLRKEIFLSRDAIAEHQLLLRPLIDRIVSANLRLVISVARKYTGYNVPLADIIQEGNLGLLKAVERYTLGRGSKFSTFAVWWIRQAIVRFLSDKSRIIRLPNHVTFIYQKIDRVKKTMAQQLGRQPSYQELAAAVKMPASKVRDILGGHIVPLNLDSTTEEGDTSLKDVIADTDSENPEERLVRMDRGKALSLLLSSIDQRWAAVLKMRHGVDCEKSMTLDEVGSKLGITRERVRQIESKALRYLSKHLASHHITFDQYMEDRKFSHETVLEGSNLP